MEALEQAAHEVEVYENYVERITSVHNEVRRDVDWQAIANDPRPREPGQTRGAEIVARDRLQNYRPGFLTNLLGSAEKKKVKLEKEVEAAIKKDKKVHEAALAEYRKDVAEWEEQSGLAQRVLAREPEAFAKALEVVGSFSEIQELGSHLEFQISDSGVVHVTVKVHSKDIVPEHSKSLLKSGRLSEKTLPKGKFFELYQDYVCGVVLRVANEVLAVLPVGEVVVTASDDLLDTATGHMREQPIVSAFVPRRTIRGLNMDLIDPSDAMENFIHEMAFKKTSGFLPVRQVEPPGQSDQQT